MAILDLTTIDNRSDSVSVASLSVASVQTVVVVGANHAHVSVDESIDGENWTATGTVIRTDIAVVTSVNAKNAKFFSFRVTIVSAFPLTADFLVSGTPLRNIPTIPGEFILDTASIGNTLGAENSIHVGKFKTVAIQSVPQGSAGAEAVVLTESLDRVNFLDSSASFVEDGLTKDIDVAGLNWLNVRVTTAGTISLKLFLIGEPH